MNPEEFLRRKGIDPAFAKGKCGVKWDSEHLIFPMNGGASGHKWRNVNTKAMWLDKTGVTDPVFIPFWMTVGSSQNPHHHIHITEGETDSILLAQTLASEKLEATVIAAPGATNTKGVSLLIEKLSHATTHLTTYPDADEAGAAMAKIGERFGAWSVEFPKGYDLCDFLQDIRPPSLRWQALQVLRWHKAKFIRKSTGEENVFYSTEASSGLDATPTESRRFREALRLLKINGRGWGQEKVICPWHEDEEPSLSINWDRCLFRCWACDIGGGYRKLEDLTTREFLEALWT